MSSLLSFRDLTSEDLNQVSSLGIASKRSWGYDDDQMRVFASEPTLSPNALAGLLVAEVACLGQELVGYYTIRQHMDGVVELEHLFVAPERFKQGIGSSLLQRAAMRVSSMGIAKLTIIADPNSAGFYERHGARKIGDHQSSIPNRVIPIYELFTHTTMNWNPADYAKNSSAQLGWARELISRMAFTGSEAVLDVGCGDGKITAEFARVLPRGLVLGVDSSPEFVSYASHHYPQSEFPPLQFRQMDARALTFERQFDLIFSNATLHWVDDHRAFLQGAAKLLRPEGRLVLSCGGAGNARAIIAVLERLLSSQEWSRYFAGFEFPYHFHSPDEYSAWLPEANLIPVRCALVGKDMVHDGPDGLAGWIRTTWMPYTERLPHELRERFISEFVSLYLKDHPADSAGRTHVEMIRLEVEATRT